MNVQPRPLSGTAFAAPRDPSRTFRVDQNANEASTTISLGRSWPAKPVSLLLNGKSYKATELDAFWVALPKLANGEHAAQVVLANGDALAITLSVRTIGTALVPRF